MFSAEKKQDQVIGKFEIISIISRAMVRVRPECLFVFGDNVQRRGFAGQAGVMRGEPNTCGIPTKWRPSMDESAFFSDDEIDVIAPLIQERLLRVQFHMFDKGAPVVWPESNPGTGYAQLDRRAPKVYSLITEARAAFERNERLTLRGLY